jgi:predicted ATPase
MALIRADLASLVPGIRSLDVKAEGDGLTVEIESADGQRFPSRVLSDGTLRILALSTLLRAGPAGALVAIEEPENGLYPARMRTLVERLLGATAASEPPQVLVTSHSPVVLAALVDHPEAIRCFDMVRQGTGLRRTRIRTVAPAGAIDREQYVSSGELRRILEAASPTAAGEP